MATTGERIREARLRAGLTQTELADKVGLKFSAICKYEKGRVVNLRRETILALAEALNVRPSYLMCADEEDLASAANPDEDIIILSRAAKKMSPADRKKLLDMARVMFDEAFDD